jgi:hypothetical protein
LACVEAGFCGSCGTVKMPDTLSLLVKTRWEELLEALAAHQALLALGDDDAAQTTYERFRARLLRWFYLEAVWLLPPYAERIRPRPGGQASYFQTETRTATANLAVFDRKLELLPPEEPARSRFLVAYFADLSAFRDYLEHHFLRLLHHLSPALEAELQEEELRFLHHHIEEALWDVPLPALPWSAHPPEARPVPPAFQTPELSWWWETPLDGSQLRERIQLEAQESFFRFQVGLLYQDAQRAQEELLALLEALRRLFAANHAEWDDFYDSLPGFRNGRSLLEGHERRIEELLLALAHATASLSACPDGRSWWLAWTELWDRSQLTHYVMRFYLERSWAALIEQVPRKAALSWQTTFRRLHPAARWLNT